MRRWKPGGYTSRGTPKRVRSFDRGDFEFSSVMQSPGDDNSMLDPETGAFIFNERERVTPAISEELPYSPELW